MPAGNSYSDMFDRFALHNLASFFTLVGENSTVSCLL